MDSVTTYSLLTHATARAYNFHNKQKIIKQQRDYMGYSKDWSGNINIPSALKWSYG
jgi:hypothetical protein